MALETVALFLALLIGLSLGALGSGGSIVTLPILVYVAGVAPESAVGMSMAIVGGTSLAGAFLHWWRGTLVPRIVVLFSVFGMAGAYVGSIGTHLVSASVLMSLFSILMLIVGTRMLFGKQPVDATARVCVPSRCVPAAFLVGLVTGFLGVGGGFLIVPALVWFAGIDTKKAIGTSLGIIAANSVAGLSGQMQYAHWDWALTGRFVVCALIGMGAGFPIARRTPEQALRKAFAIVLIAVSAAIAWQVIYRR
ncbi:MAG: sulfite exporter TauE/SafE family protein [Bryobacteraceae bacterium]